MVKSDSLAKTSTCHSFGFLAINDVHRPKLLNLPIVFHQYELISSNLILEFSGKFGHVVIGVQDYKLYLIIFEGKIMRYAPFPFMAIIAGLVMLS